MIKRLLTAVMAVLALNFIGVVGATGWLFKSGRLDGQKLAAIRQMVFTPATAPTTGPVEAAATTGPSGRLQEILSHVAGKPMGQQVDLVQRELDARSAELDGRERELQDLQHQVETARADVSRQRQAVAAREEALNQREKQAAALADDAGFQTSLQLYETMPAPRAKALLMAMDDATVVQFLQAMEPRTATKIINEFKSPEELSRIQKIMERMRQPIASPQQATAGITPGP
jgi:multidrug efflux pump subunit AcrA (membrane-fusion protein)